MQRPTAAAPLAPAPLAPVLLAPVLLAPVLACLVAALACAPAARAAEKFYVYNETTVTDFKGVYLAPAGTRIWGMNQALNDDDKELDRTERLLLTGLAHRTYDVKLVDQNGHACVLPGIDLAHEKTFEIKDADLARCK